MRGKGPEIELIRFLRAGPGPVSGQGLSGRLGVSRTAVWKHIKALRKMGYLIEASPSKGYTLKGPSPFNGVEVSSLLDTALVGREVHFFDVVGSTNVKAFELARGGAPEGTVVMADSQTSGKGRVGRRWESPPGLNVYASVILRPSIAPREAHELTFVAAVAMAEAVSGFSPVRPAVKWPNDILVDGGKVAGILLEMDSEPDRVHFVVVGMGVNVNMTRIMFPEYLRETAASLRELAGGPVDRAGFARRLLTGVEAWYKVYLSEGFAPVLAEWRTYFAFEGRPVTVTSFESVIKGVCLGVDSDGALLLEREGGTVVRVVSGDVEAERA